MIATFYRKDYGVLALQVVFRSTVKVHVNLFPLLKKTTVVVANADILLDAQDPSYLDVRVDEFFKMFESKIYELSDKDFKVSTFGFPFTPNESFQ